jgi:hypothetical protein
MPRTRDFVLFAVTAAFLMVGIGVSAIAGFGVVPAKSVPNEFVDTEDVEYVAVYDAPKTLSHEERLAAMREKVIASQSLSLSETLPSGALTPVSEESIPSLVPSATSSLATSDPLTPESPLIREPLLCSNYLMYQPVSWPMYSGGVQIEVAEGARLVYQEVVGEYKPDLPTATTGTAVPPELKKSVLLQLPIRLSPAATPSCMQYDVVGVAQDGSLIRNGEVGLYGIFGAETLIGYALDGFPIYGTSPTQGDTCGGVMVAGQYRYHLSVERDTVLNCFSAPPVRLP